MRFLVKAVQGRAAPVEMEIEASAPSSARLEVERSGFEVLAVRPIRSFRLGGKGQADRLDVVEFGESLSALLDAGLTLVESIDILGRRSSSPSHQASLARVVDGLRRGSRLADALESSGVRVPPLFIATVRASEGTGTLTEALSRYIQYEQHVEQARSRLVSAAIYPALLLAVGGLVMSFLLAYVVPRFSRLYREVDADLPWGSRVLMELGQAIDGRAQHLLIGVVAIAGMGYSWLRSSQGRRAVAAVLRSIPGLYARLRLFELARLYRGMSLLIRSGVNMLATIELVKGALSPELSSALAKASSSISEGQSLSDAFDRNNLTTEVASRMLVVAERTGSLSDMLERIAAFHERELTRWVERATRLFEPVLMAVIGLVIGIIVVLMYMPIFDLASSLG